MVCALQRRDEAVHEPFGRQIEHLAIAAVAGPGDRLQQMGFAEPDAGVDVERIEHQRIAAPADGDLFRRGMRERVRAADDEGLERQPRIERRTAERFVHRHERNAGAQLAVADDAIARLARRRRRLRPACGFGAGGRIVAERTLNSRRVMAGSSACHWASTRSAVMRLDPFAQKARRHRQPHRAVLDGFEFHARRTSS